MNNFLRRLKYWLHKPAGTHCRGICLNCKWFELCVKDTATAPEPIKIGKWTEYQMPMPEEYRCTICKSRFECPAYNTGVIFPCAYFKEESHGKT